MQTGKTDVSDFRVVGLMSGTSLDGLDLVLCKYSTDGSSWKFELEDSICVAYDEVWKNRLIKAYETPVERLAELDKMYGGWLGEQVLKFIKGDRNIDLIASHGHTTHHNPDKGLTNQLGCGQAIADAARVKTIFDFRSQDVALGGQGAPIVPIGDQLLFSEYDACINLGGFSNISFDSDGVRRAFDICPLNIIMNPIAEELGKPFDENGDFAQQGSMNHDLLSSLDSMMTHFRDSRPSLSREWVETNVDPIIELPINPENRLATLVEFAADEMALVLNQQKLKSALLTGGGTFNSFLIDKLKTKTECQIIIPDKTIIEFKEAIVFGFLGVLKVLGEVNVLKSVTGASKDSSSGMIAYPS